MAFSFGFYNSVNHDRQYNAVQMGMIFDGIILDGVYQTIGDAFIVEAHDEPNVITVGSGRAWFNHTWSYNDSDMILEKPQAELLLKRIDAVVLDVDNSDAIRANEIKWVLGTPSSNPVRPTMIHTLNHHQYPLAYVERRANDETINQADITNMVGTSDCPFVTGVLEGMDIDKLVLQWGDQWKQFVKEYELTAITWTEEQKADFNTFYTEFKQQILEFQTASQNEFNEWFSTIQGIFEEDPAGALFTMIEEVDEREFKHYSGIVNSKTVIEKSNHVQIETTDDVGTTTTIIQKNEGGTMIATTVKPIEGNFNYVCTTLIEKVDGNTEITTSYAKVAKEED